MFHVLSICHLSKALVRLYENTLPPLTPQVEESTASLDTTYPWTTVGQGWCPRWCYAETMSLVEPWRTSSLRFGILKAVPFLRNNQLCWWWYQHQNSTIHWADLSLDPEWFCSRFPIQSTQKHWLTHFTISNASKSSATIRRSCSHSFNKFSKNDLWTDTTNR